MVPNSVVTIKKLAANFKSVSDIKAAFKRFDANGDGQITRNEMKNGMRCSDSELDVIYALGDLDGDGEISVGEFIRVMSPSTAAALQRFRNTFACIEDVISDGEICYDEFVAMMFPAAASALAKFRKHHRTLKNAKHAFDSYDVDGDGEITYEELVGGMGGDYSANEI